MGFMHRPDGDVLLTAGYSPILQLAFVTSPLPILGAVAWFRFHGLFLLLAFLALYAYVLLSIGTTRVLIHDRRISLRRFGLVKWIADTSQITLVHGIGGEMPVVPSLLVIDTRSGEQVGQILKSHYNTSDFNKFVEAAVSLGIPVEKSKRRRKRR